MTDVSSKSVSARIPMIDYIRFLREASEKGQTVSEWLILKVYQDDKIEALQEELKTLEALHKKAEKNASDDIAKLNKEITELQKSKDLQTAMIKKTQAEAADAIKEGKALAEQIKLLKSKLVASEKENKENQSAAATERAEILKLNNGLKQSETKWKKMFEDLIKKNQTLEASLIKFNQERLGGIPNVLKIVKEHLQTS